MVEVRDKYGPSALKALAGFPEVVGLHTTNGRWDVATEIKAASLADLDAVLRRIRLIDGIAATETSILLSTQKY